ncbi:TM2 domain-containing protein [Ferrimicrobium sp.]|uniref:TM2 domain-containing protein n=1 Tax=Ferrimicrobium sp. TaxID=2926050 RepID=UPI00262526D0|nr:TM2 domain-containing protein [Ferrimicrobium sp.]
MKTVIALVILAAIIAFVVWRSKEARKQEEGEVNNLMALPPSVGQAVSMMDPMSQAAFFQEYQSQKKSLGVAYILWLLFGFHYLYFRMIGLQILYWITGGGFGIWAIVDLFRMPSIRRQYNEKVARQALQTLQVGATFQRPSAQVGFAQPQVASPNPAQTQEIAPTLGENDATPGEPLQ